MASLSLKNHFLVAQEELTDSNFSRAVVYIFEHGPEGAAGVVINKPSKLTIEDLSNKIYSTIIPWDKPVLIGGPVGGPLLIVHQDSDWSDDEVSDEIFRTVDPEKIRHMLEAQIEPSILIANYAGWGPNQLENEIEEGSWAILEAESRFVFWNEVRDLWDVLMAACNVRSLRSVLKIRRSPIDPTIN
jgi:putative transcriptional regulator